MSQLFVADLSQVRRHINHCTQVSMKPGSKFGNHVHVSIEWGGQQTIQSTADDACPPYSDGVIGRDLYVI